MDKQRLKELRIDAMIYSGMLLFGFLGGFILIASLESRGYQITFHDLGTKAPVLNDNNCTGMNLFQTSHCLNREVNSFFKYNLSNRYNDLTVDQLKASGGVCWQWTNYYMDRVKGLGFDVKKVVLPIGNESHVFALASSGEGYCILDQASIYCEVLE